MHCRLGLLVRFIFNDLLTHLLTCHKGIWILIQCMLKVLDCVKQTKNQNYWTETDITESSQNFLKETAIISHSSKHGISCSLRYIVAFSWLQFKQQDAYGTVSLYVHSNRCLLQVLPAPQTKSRDSIHNAGMSKIITFLV